MSVRTDRISASIRRALQEAMARGINDPRVRGLITVTEVEVSQDLRTAVVRISVLPESAQELTLHGLTSAAGLLRRQIGSSVRMRRVPELRFQLDDTLKRQARVLSAIARAREDEAAAPPATEAEAEAETGADPGSQGAGEPGEPSSPDDGEART